MEKTYVFEAEYQDEAGFVEWVTTIEITGGTFDAAYAHAESIAYDLEESEEMVDSGLVEYIEVRPATIEVTVDQ